MSQAHGVLAPKVKCPQTSEGAYMCASSKPTAINGLPSRSLSVVWPSIVSTDQRKLLDVPEGDSSIDLWYSVSLMQLLQNCSGKYKTKTKTKAEVESARNVAPTLLLPEKVTGTKFQTSHLLFVSVNASRRAFEREKGGSY